MDDAELKREEEENSRAGSASRCRRVEKYDGDARDAEEGKCEKKKGGRDEEHTAPLGKR